MRVFNLTDKSIDYRGKTMGPYGHSDHPDLVDLSMVPTRDLAMQKAGMLAFGVLPTSWKKPEPVAPPAPPAPPAKKVEVKLTEAVKVEATAAKAEVMPAPAEVKDESKESKKSKPK